MEKLARDKISSAMILHRWGLLGHTARILPKWEPMQALIEAVERYSQAHREELRRVLKVSDATLQPLSDPLTPNLGLNRWLAAEREESYSDWLAWVIQQLTTDQVLAVFGISHDSQPFDSGTKPIVARERPVPGGRLDIKVTAGEDILLVIEVKKTSEQEADTDKQKGYSDWINSESNQSFKYKKSILLVTDVSDDYRKNAGSEFAPLLWGEFCIRLRRMLADSEFFRERGLVTSALIIAFIGAVEQNLLDFVSPDADLGRSLRYASTADHIKQALIKQPMEGTLE